MAGRGRGLTLPAWMANDSLTAEPSIPATQSRASQSATDGTAPSSSSSGSSGLKPEKAQTKKIISSIPKPRRNLSFILGCLQGHEVVLELKNESEVRGYVEDVSDKMDITLAGVRQTTSTGEETHAETALVKGHSVRFVHISSSIPVSRMTSEHARKLEYLSRKNKPGKFSDKKKDSTPSIYGPSR